MDTNSSQIIAGFLNPIQQPGSYWDRSSVLPLMGVNLTQREQSMIICQTCLPVGNWGPSNASNRCTYQFGTSQIYIYTSIHNVTAITNVRPTSGYLLVLIWQTIPSINMYIQTMQAAILLRCVQPTEEWGEIMASAKFLYVINMPTVTTQNVTDRWIREKKHFAKAWNVIGIPL